jgi:hypothetical protein
MKTRFEIIVDHNAPLDPEKIGFAISESLKPIMERHNRKFRSQVTQSTINILEHNVPERTTIELPPITS